MGNGVVGDNEMFQTSSRLGRNITISSCAVQKTIHKFYGLEKKTPKVVLLVTIFSNNILYRVLYTGFCSLSSITKYMFGILRGVSFRIFYLFFLRPGFFLWNPFFRAREPKNVFICLGKTTVKIHSVKYISVLRHNIPRKLLFSS